jgi:dTDP-4-amino-4,6-dideoxygalactose transaminase
MVTEVPFADLGAQYQSIKGEIDAAIASVIAETAFVRGRFVADFEQAFAGTQGIPHFVGTANGTDALFVALKTLGIGPGDEVITAANSWIASSECITLCGATPVFADVDPDTYNVNPEDVANRVTARTRAIIPVHLYGQAADMVALQAIAAKHDLSVVEDCAQAHLATVSGRSVGTFGDAGTFSFYPGKNLGAYGDAGGVGTGDEELALRMRMFANHGADPAVKHDHRIEGINSRLDGIQAAILSAKLAHLRGWTDRRRSLAALYDSLLSDVGDVVTPVVAPSNEHVYHVYCIRTDQRDGLRAHLGNQGVQTGVHYPRALPFVSAYERLSARPEDFPVAYANQSRLLSLPMYAEMSDESVHRVVAAIAQFFEEGS